jgi:tetratricopeptide (TPR) repeat protein
MDALDERQRVKWIADRLSGEFAQIVRFETILWEKSVYHAGDGGFQPQIDARATPARSDIVIGIFKERLGTPLPDSFPRRMPDGTPYASGTVYEILSALEAARTADHAPVVYVFRKSIKFRERVPVDKAEREEADRQWDRLEEFFEGYFEPADKRILRAVERFKNIADFEQKIEQSLREWIERNNPRRTIWSIEQRGSPFRGLAPFEAKHADVYCGRDRKVLRAIDELVIAAESGKPFLLIPGASGSGKSSLMRAGIAPRLVRSGMVKKVDGWRTAAMRPAADRNPMLALARTLFVAGDVEDDPGGFGKALPELKSGAYPTPEELANLLETAAVESAVKPIIAALEQVSHAETTALQFERPLRANLLLLVDQLEDIFAETTTPSHRERFANLLAALVNTQRVWVIATLRGDMFERMITDSAFKKLKDRAGQFDLAPPGPDELDEIVHQSAEVTGLRYEERVVNGRRERLDDRLLQDAAGENTLPLLQFALNLLFEKCSVSEQPNLLTIAAYEEIGGLDGAINQSAEMALARLVRPGVPVNYPLERGVLDDIERKINPRLEPLLRKLVVPVALERQGGGAAAERALTTHIVPMNEARLDNDTGELIDAMLQARVLLALPQGSFVRIAHDRVISSWERAQRLTEKNRDFYRVKDAIDHQRKRWEESARSVGFLIPAGMQLTQAEKMVQQFPQEFKDSKTFLTASSRRARLRQRLMTAATLVFAVVAVFATLAAFYATKQRHLATQNYEYATQQRQVATQNYEAARGTVSGLISTFAQGLTDVDGIQVGTVQEALTKVDKLLQNLEKQDSQDDELKRIRASMHYEFARVFQNNRNLPEALREADKGLTIRSGLAAHSSEKPEWEFEHAEILDLASDIHRAIAVSLSAPDAAVSGHFDAAANLLHKAHPIHTRLHSANRTNAAWAIGLSKCLVRMGDLKVEASKDVTGARADYQHALDLILDALRHDPDNEKLQRECSWDLSKIADTLAHPRLREKDSVGALRMYGKALCIRRYLMHQKPLSATFKRDVAFTLEKVGNAKSDTNDHEGAIVFLIEALQLRRELIETDPGHRLRLNDYAVNALSLGRALLKSGDFAPAGGFFQIAVEKLEPVVHRDKKAKEWQAAARAGYQTAVAGLDPKTRLKLGDTRSMQIYLNAQAAEKEAQLRELVERNRVDPVEAWSRLKADLLKTSVVQQVRNN